LQRHLTLLDYIKFFSLYLKGLTEEDKVDGIDEHMENRARLINLTADVQNDILEGLQQFNLSQNRFAAELTHAWSNDTTRLIQEIDQIDRTIQLNLEVLKEQTTKQISHLFRARGSFKGYNLTTTKR